MKVGTRPDNPLEALGMLAGLAPAPLFEGYFGLMASRTLIAGVNLGVFVALEEQPDNADGLAGRLGLDPRGVDALLIALHAMGYLDRAEAGYRPSGKARKHLLPDSTRRLDEVVGGFAVDMWGAFTGIEDAIRAGGDAELHGDRPPDDPFWERYMRALLQLADLRSAALTALIPASDPKTLLDLAGGHGGYSMAMCERHDGLKAKVVELEGAARIGRKLVAERGMSDRVEHIVADIFEGDYGNAYDVAMTNSILHHFEPDRNGVLLGRALDALAPGGTLAVIEQERPAEGERGEQIGALTGMLFYLTSRVRTYTAGELVEMVEQAGFERVRARRSISTPGIVVVTAKKPKEAR
jgi:hypothetical protein